MAESDSKYQDKRYCRDCNTVQIMTIEVMDYLIHLNCAGCGVSYDVQRFRA